MDVTILSNEAMINFLSLWISVFSNVKFLISLSTIWTKGIVKSIIIEEKEELGISIQRDELTLLV